MGLGELRIDPLQVIFLALIQGITEFLPISSSGHLILAARAMGWEDQGLSFDIAVHGGSLTALVLYFRRELAGFGASVARLSWDSNVDLLAKVAVAAAPIALAGWLIQPFAETALRDVGVVAAAIIGFAIALWWADRRRGTGDLASVTFAQAALIGVAQTAALIPGASRAGVTITAALLLGLSRQGAARFSFLLAMPTIAGALLLAALDPGDVASRGLGEPGAGLCHRRCFRLRLHRRLRGAGESHRHDALCVVPARFGVGAADALVTGGRAA